MQDSKANFKKGAKISLVIVMLSIAAHIAVYYQTMYLLVADLLPRDTIYDITDVYIFRALVSTLTCLAALIFYFYDKYLVAIVICVLTLLFQQIMLFI